MSKRKMHYKTNQFFNFPISGRHTIFACGKHQQDNYQNVCTLDWSKVTCKACLKKKEK